MWIDVLDMVGRQAPQLMGLVRKRGILWVFSQPALREKDK